MDKKRINAKVKKVVDYFAKRLEEEGVKVSRIVVFGSHSKGTARPDSDIDLIIVSENFRRKNLFERIELILRAYSDTTDKFIIPMDIILETPEEFNPDFGTVVFAA
jgi:uncharacterized protein